jgi:hypothetical protein
LIQALKRRSSQGQLKESPHIGSLCNP